MDDSEYQCPECHSWMERVGDTAYAATYLCEGCYCVLLRPLKLEGHWGGVLRIETSVEL